MRGIIAEDNNQLRKLIRNYLRNYKIEIEEVSNGKQLVDKVERNNYDFILTDFSMPYVDGITAVKHFRKLNYQKLIVVMSMHYDHTAQKSLEAGANLFIDKKDLIDGLNVLIKSLKF